MVFWTCDPPAVHGTELRCMRVVDSEGVTHLRFRFVT